MKNLLKKTKAKEFPINADNSNIIFSSEPQEYLGILNAGLSNGINTEVLLEEVTKYAQLTDIRKDPKKVLEVMNGKSKLGQNGAPLLMSFCARISDENEVCPRQNFTQNKLPSGLILIEDCVSEDLEKKILSSLSWSDNDDEKRNLKYRKVQHFGYEFIYGSNNVDPKSPLRRKIPDVCNDIWKNLDQNILPNFTPDQLTVNEYEPGHGIPPHCDTHSCFEDPIVSLSLGSSVVMEFRNPESSKHLSVFLPQRSLLIMSGESRYGWTHGITPRMSDIVTNVDGILTVQSRQKRTSFTFRKLRIPSSCSCSFPSLCDVKRKPDNIIEMHVTNELAAKLEIEKVHKVYNEIGSHFSETRHSTWPNVEDFLKSLPEGSILCDVGCGNGKYLGVNEGIFKLGCDRSETLLQVCLQRNFNIFQCDCLQLPVRDISIDACISIAVIHHLATEERRKQAISEILRVLVIEGTALIYVWAKDQQKDNKKSSYLLQNQKQEKSCNNQIEKTKIIFDENEIELPIHQNRTQFHHTNLLVPWKLKEKDIPKEQQKVFLRYYHVFEDGELENLCKEFKNVDIIKSYYDQGNHCVVIKKTSF
ncbi:CLUMA_CG018032, isoform A [Clunio marinus]|uniref:CLUMA_CG018032, isoform A n=1 Tax=Clunio marinus TaxID=568069 RepID=A0A1J1IZI6_9DIPT|nr:CLUMA_CG018032, isoform A [Clunio marinus]